ncbi:hypothetical protein [Pseudanabaena sp. 'Roaring Creek']|uniref:hypothetical protein n=1 Tax=Pseudanabaena sp. 'Roaring Creek' TaxID=1681830 RepID=UPI0006D804AB|nr:hypothetical protein [Pseudanabaena sp. 'Roaring Creek']
MVDINTIELALKYSPEFDLAIAKTVPSLAKRNYLIGSCLAIGLGLFAAFLIPSEIANILGGGITVMGIGMAIYSIQSQIDDSIEAQEERIKLKIAQSVRRAKVTVTNEQKKLTKAAHTWHRFSFDNGNNSNHTITFNSYIIKIANRPDCLNVDFRIEQILYRTEVYAEFYSTKSGELKSRQRQHKVPDRVKFTISLPNHKRTVKGVMGFDDYHQMTSLYSARHQKALDLAEFHHRYAIAEEHIRNDGKRIYLSPEEKQAIAHRQELAEFDLMLGKDQAMQAVSIAPIVTKDLQDIQESLQKSLQELTSIPSAHREPTPHFSESDLRSIGLPAIRQQFNITARSYANAFVKLREKGIIINAP